MPRPKWKLLMTDGPWEIKLSPEGDIGCNCPSFRNQKLPIKLRSCKHLKRNAEEIIKLVGATA